MASQWSQIARKRKSAKIVNADFDGNTSFFVLESVKGALIGSNIYIMLELLFFKFNF